MATAGKIILGMLKGAGKLIKGVLGLAGGSLKLTAAFDVWGVYKLTGTDPPQWTLDVLSDAEDTLKGLKDYLLKIKSDPSLILEQTAQEISDTADHKGAYGIGEVGFDIALAVLPGVGAAAKGVKAADKVGDAAKIAKAVSVGDKASVIEYLKAANIAVKADKVLGKIPIDDYIKYLKDSFKNSDGESMILGHDGYVKAAQDSNSAYFHMGDEFDKIKSTYKLTEKEMFDLFNKPALDQAIASGKTFKFTHNPMAEINKLNGEPTYLKREWEYLKKCGYKKVKWKDGFWIAYK
jgi:hypothetical protein